MKAKEFMQKFLSNKYVLMVTTVIAVLNLIGYMAINDFESVIYFILVGLITFFFSKNMIIVFGIPIIVVNLIRVKHAKEGMENHSNSTDTINVSNSNKPKQNNNNSNTSSNTNSNNQSNQFKVE